MIPEISDITVGDEISAIDRIVDGYKTYQVLRAALDRGLFDWLDEHGPATREEIGSALSINGMFTRSLFQTLVELGFLVQKEDRFANSSTAAHLLVKRSAAYQGDWILNAADEQGPWSRLEETLALTAPKNTGFSAGPGPQFLRALAERTLRGEVQDVTKILSEWNGFDSATKLLDVGGGHGLYAIAACQKNPRLRAVVFDKPHVIGITEEFIRAYGMEDRITVRGGDIVTDDPGSGYDIVMISHLLYKFRADLPAIFGKVAAGLRPGGLFVSNHWFCGPVCGEGSAGIRELDRSIHSYGHPLCHPEDFASGMFSKGLVVTKKTTVRSNFGQSHVHVAEKAAEQNNTIPEYKGSCGCESCR